MIGMTFEAALWDKRAWIFSSWMNLALLWLGESNDLNGSDHAFVAGRLKNCTLPTTSEPFSKLPWSNHSGHRFFSR